MKCPRCETTTPDVVINIHTTMSKRFIIEYLKCCICSYVLQTNRLAPHRT